MLNANALDSINYIIYKCITRNDFFLKLSEVIVLNV